MAPPPTILRTDIATLYQLGLAANPANPDLIYRVYFDSSIGAIYFVNQAFEVLYSNTSGVAGAGSKISATDICAIGDFGLDSDPANINFIYRMYIRTTGRTHQLIIADRNFFVIYSFDLVTVAPTKISKTDIAVLYQLPLNADPSNVNRIYRMYLHPGTDIEIDPTKLMFVNQNFEDTDHLIMS